MTAAERRTLIAEIDDEAQAYGPTWQTSTLIAEVRRYLTACEVQLIDGESAAHNAQNAAAVALALAARVHS